MHASRTSIEAQAPNPNHSLFIVFVIQGCHSAADPDGLAGAEDIAVLREKR